MPRKAKGPYLYWHKRDKAWIIRDGQTFRRTGCGGDELADAQVYLAQFIAAKFKPEIGQKRPDRVTCEAIIIHYMDINLPKKTTRHRFNELKAQGVRLIEFWGAKNLDEIKGSTCRQYTESSSTTSMARHDLEIFRAAVNFYNREFGLNHLPVFTLPKKGKAKTGWLTRDQVAALLWHAHKSGKPHLARFILIAVYTGTRMTPVLQLQWFANTTAGYVDLKREVMYRAPPGSEETNKRKPPVTIPNRLLTHLKRWHRMDTSGDATIRQIINYKGEKIANIKKSWDTTKALAGLPDWADRHCLRHTSITWAMQSGTVPLSEAEGFFGITAKVMREVYHHHHPDFQKNIKKVF